VNGFIDHLHHSELQVITALSLMSTRLKSPHNPKSLFPACCVVIRRSLATASNSGGSSASRAQVLSSQPPVQNSTDNRNRLPGWLPFHTNFLVFPSQADFQLTGSESESLYDWPFTAKGFVLATGSLRLTSSNFIFQLNTYGYSPYVTSSLMRRWVCRL
jgi:hypothetical protein